eukprot:CAMPEP_0117659894 /NCGR_PEP_ID=MMETSP0804-20121206/6671_1 /TAXON_ID=1074897 /ORGANISM="Tetraselmis astigmatica, Strain CCMP880" /LENGTH=90 /DNA_ID=CAMNT_0005466573 /DNA_START=262 /DNA_END=534 /DNA_ORIENTATION=-
METSGTRAAIFGRQPHILAALIKEKLVTKACHAVAIVTGNSQYEDLMVLIVLEVPYARTTWKLLPSPSVRRERQGTDRAASVEDARVSGK